MPDDLVDEPGDPVCWLHRLCPECGAMPTGEQPERCWRCGAPLADDPALTTRRPTVHTDYPHTGKGDR